MKGIWIFIGILAFLILINGGCIKGKEPLVPEEKEKQLRQLGGGEPGKNITIYLDGEPIDRKYEYETYSNITAIVDNSSISLCIDLDAPDYGDNYTCGTLGESINISYLVGDLSSDNWTVDESETLDFTLSKTQQINMTSKENVTITQLEFNITGKDNSGYPIDLFCDVANDGSIDFYLVGNLTGNIIHQSYSEGLQTNTITYPTAGSSIIYVNLSSFDLTNMAIENGTINLTGGTANPESYDYTEYYWNDSYIYDVESTVTNQWQYENFSLGDISGRWSGSYSVSTGKYVGTSSSCTCSGTGNCDNSNTDSKSSNFYSQTLDFTEYGSMFIKVNVQGSGSYDSNPCTETAGGSGSGSLSIRDKTLGSNVLSVHSESCGDSGVGSGSSTGCSDTSIWEFRKVGNKIMVYDDGVYDSEVAFDSTHQYEVYLSTSCSCESWKYDAGGSGSAYIYNINMTGITGEMTGDFTWGNGSVTSEMLANFSSNITSATLTATESVPDNTETHYYLSADNGTTWESVQSGINHVFAVGGQYLKYRANATGTSVQDSDGDLSEQAIIKDIRIQVIAGTPENISLDIGADGVNEWEMNGTLYSNESIVANWIGSSVTDYMSDNCIGELTCLFPIKLTTEAPGAIVWNLLDQNQTIEKIVVSELDNLTIQTTENSTLPIACSTTALQGDVNFTSLDLRYIADGNVTVFAYDANDVTVNDTKTIMVRYSDFEFNWPLHIPGFYLIPTNLTDYNVTPIRQTIEYCDNDNRSLGYCENESIPIFNVTNLAKTDPIDIYLKYDMSAGCINITADDDINKTGGIMLNNETSQKIIDNLQINSNQGIWTWVDLIGCSISDFVWYNITFKFDSLCDECVVTSDAFRD